MASTLLLGLIPFLFGFLLELVVLMPVRVPVTQSPVLYLWQDWVLGVMYTKITVGLTFMGPDWWLKRAIEQLYQQLYQDGLRGLDVKTLVPRLVMPVVTVLGLALSLPYIVSHSIVPLLIKDAEAVVLIQRRIYPSLLIMVLLATLVIAQLKQFRKLYEHIKNDK